jgi:hypothetical protein
MKRDKRLIWLAVAAVLAVSIAAGVLMARQTAGPALETCRITAPAAAEPENSPQPPLSEREKQTLAGQNNEPIVRINGRDIPHWMFDNALRDRVGDKKPSKQALNKAREEILANLIDMELLAAEANRLGLAVGQAGGMLRLAIVERSYKSPEAFNQSLAEAGMTRRQYADLWRQQATVNRLVAEKIEAQVSVTEEEIKQIYEEEKQPFETKDETSPLEKAHPRLSEAIRKAKAKMALDKYLADLRSKANIEVFADWQ